jgi:hypothetical protein
MAKSKFQQAQEDYPMVASALKTFPPARMAMGIGNAIDQANQGNYRNAISEVVPGAKTLGKVFDGDLAGAAKDVLLGMAPPIVGKAYNYAMNDKQDPDAASVEDRSTYSPEMQDERAAMDNAAGEAAYYDGMGNQNYGAEDPTRGLDQGNTYNGVYKRGGKVKAYAKGGAVSSKPVKSTRGRGDGIAQRGHTKGRII